MGARRPIPTKFSTVRKRFSKNDADFVSNSETNQIKSQNRNEGSFRNSKSKVPSIQRGGGNKGLINKKRKRNERNDGREFQNNKKPYRNNKDRNSRSERKGNQKEIDVKVGGEEEGEGEGEGLMDSKPLFENDNAYDLLLSSLQNSNNQSFSQIYAQRKLEEEGKDEESEQEEEEEEGEGEEEGEEEGDYEEDENGEENEAENSEDDMMRIKNDNKEEEEEEEEDGDDGDDDDDDDDDDDNEEEDFEKDNEDGEKIIEGKNESNDARKEKEKGKNGTKEKMNPLAINTFEMHLEKKLSEEEIQNLIEKKFKKGLETPILGLGSPSSSSSSSSSLSSSSSSSAHFLTDQKSLPCAKRSLDDFNIKLSLKERWKEVFVNSNSNSNSNSNFGDFNSAQQSQFFSICNNYMDVLHTQNFFVNNEKMNSNVENNCNKKNDLIDACILHVLNHLIKTRDLVKKNNEKIKKNEENNINKKKDNGDDDDNEMDLREQAFTRPKVLFLIPMRNSVFKIVNRIFHLCPPSQSTSIEQKDRFLKDFGDGGEEEDEKEKEEKERLIKKILEKHRKEKNNLKEEETMDDSKPTNEKNKENDNDKNLNDDNDSHKKEDGFHVSIKKPFDFEKIFEGNTDDYFRLGLKFTKKTIKLYSDFYSSDIIFASPISLVTKIGQSEKDFDENLDFLSSIEIVVIDEADVILMQNWFHMLTVFDHLNLIPKKQHGSNFMRIRQWYLDGYAKFYRQTIIFSSFPEAGINALFHRKCFNHAGKVKTKFTYSGVLSKIVLQVRQLYERFECASINEVEDAKFEYFKNNIFPRIKNSYKGGIFIFVRTYFEFVRLRNFLKNENQSFCLLGEYTNSKDVSRSRQWFFYDKRKIMLYTERAHFYHRYRIRGIREVIFLSLPQNAHFYAEILNLIENKESPTCTVMFNRFDNLELERIVGSSRSKKLLESTNRTFMFC